MRPESLVPEHAVTQVLIADDDDALRAALIDVLETEGYTAAGVSNGVEALRFLERGPRPQVILVELMMPVMDGWELLRELGLREQLAGVPVVIMSARFTTLAAAGAPETAVRRMEKPLDLVELLRFIAETCSLLPE
jgi:CheY-like chemotaxis protein